MALTPEDWLRHINREANRALKNGISRFDVEWGKWSAEMNRHLRMRIEEGDPETPRLKVVFYYWILISQAIEFAHKKKNGANTNDNRFNEVISMAENIKESINQGVWPNVTLAEMESALGFGEAQRENT